MPESRFKKTVSISRRKAKRPAKNTSQTTSPKKTAKSKISKPILPRLTKLSKNRKKLLRTVLTWAVVFIVTLIVIDYGVQYINYKASIAIVNGERVYRGEFIEKLIETSGSSVAGQLIDKVLIYQEAEAEGIEVKDEDIDAELDILEEKYGGKDELEQEMELQNISMEELRDRIKTTLLLEELLEDRIEITEDEKKEFFEEYKNVLFTEDEDPTYEEAEEKVEETLRDQKFGQEVQVWLQEVRDDATIKNNIDDPKDMTFLGITREFFRDLFEG